MKKVFKKAVAAVMATTMIMTAAFSLASCGKETDAIKIGASGPLTGDVASYGISVKNGASLAIKHLNEQGGLQFAFDMMDDKGTPTDASTNYDVLADNGMQLSLGGVTSGAAEAFAKKANVDGIFCMSPSASADPVIKDMDYSFRLCFGDPDQGDIAADYIKNNGYTKVGAMYDSSDSYSSGIYEAFKAKMASYGITYTETSFTKETNRAFDSQAEALKDCDIIFMPFYYTEASLMMQKATEKNFKGVFFGCDGFDGIASYIEGITNKIMYITPFDVNSTKDNVKAFVEAYTAEYGSAPDQFAADAYDVVMVLAAALAKAGVNTYDLTAQEISDLVLATVTSADFSYTGLTGTMTWDKSGACNKAPNIVEFN